MVTHKTPTIVQINVTANSGSTGRIVEGITRLVSEEGWHPVNFYGRFQNRSIFTSNKLGNQIDLILHLLRTRLFDGHGLGSKRGTRKLIRKLTALNPDIVHLHNIHGYYINYPILFKYLQNIETPIIWTLHDCWAFTGHCTFFDLVQCDKWKTACNKCPQINSYPASFLVDRSDRNYYLKKRLFNISRKINIVPVSDWLKSKIEHSFLQKNPVITIRNGINLQVFKYTSSNLRERYHLEEKKIILGVASGWEKRKGLDDFIKLSAMLNRDTKIVLIGLHKKQLKSLPQSIIGLQKTESTEELAAWYSAADVYFNPTWEDNYPTTNLEAIACGTPVISYRTGGSVESVQKETGKVIKQGDIEAFLNEFESITKKGKDHYQLQCRKYAEANFDANLCFTKYIDLYKKLMER